MPHSHATHSAHMHSLSFNFQLSIRPPPSNSISAALIHRTIRYKRKCFQCRTRVPMYHTLTHTRARTLPSAMRTHQQQHNGKRFRAIHLRSSEPYSAVVISSIRSAAQSFTAVAANFPACGLDWCAGAVVCALGLRREFIYVYMFRCGCARFSVYKCKGTRSNQNSSLLLPVRGSSFSSPEYEANHTHRSMCLCRPFFLKLCKMFSSVKLCI